LRDVGFVGAVAIVVILVVLLGSAAVTGLLNPPPYAQVVIRNSSDADLVVQLAGGADSRVFDVPTGANLLLPDDIPGLVGLACVE